MPFPAIGLGTIAFLGWLGVDIGLIATTGYDSIDHVLSWFGLVDVSQHQDIVFEMGLSFSDFLINYSISLVFLGLIVVGTWFFSTRPLKVKTPTASGKSWFHRGKK